MKRTAQDSLLRDTLAGDALDSLRTASLAGMLDVARRRRRRRAIGSAAAASVAIVMLTLIALHRKEPAALRPVQPADVAKEIETISDQQLLALFPNRPVALIGAVGEQQLMFLDRVTPPASRPRIAPIDANR